MASTLYLMILSIFSHSIYINYSNTITCSTDTDCVIDCGTQSCKNNTIMGSNANSLTILCRNPSNCTDSIIECPNKDDSSCYITCSGDESCKGASITINTTQLHHLNVSCFGEYSCSAMTLTTMNVQNATSVFVECNGNNGCQEASFDFGDIAFIQEPVYIGCPGSESCSDAFFDFAAINEVHVQCGGAVDDPFVWETSCQGTSIHAEDTQAFQLKCSGTWSCKESKIWCPYTSLNACQIVVETKSWATQDMEIHVGSDYLYGYLDLVCPITSYSFPCGDIAFECYENEGSYHKYSTKLIQNEHNQQYECENRDPAYCCPWVEYPIIELQCDEAQHCVAECSSSNNCTNALINGTSVSTLNVSCRSDRICQSVQIICPIGGDCNIDCNGDHACFSASIRYDGIGDDMDIASNIDLICDGYFSCWWMEIYAMFISSIHITSYGNSTSSLYAEQAGEIDFYCENCAGWSVYAVNAGKYNMFCNGFKGCDSMAINATNVESLAITANGSSAFYADYGKGKVYAYNATTVNITCISSHNGSHSCFGGSFYVPSKGLSVNCYGTACYNLGDIWVWDTLQNATLNINGCGECDALETCTSNWTVYCNLVLWENAVPTFIWYDKKDVFNGALGKCESNDCGCNVLMKQANANFQNNNAGSMCPYRREETTLSPTTDGKAEKSDVWIWVVVGVVGVVLVVVVSVLLMVWKKRNDQPHVVETEYVTMQ